ncbi:MAG: cbb3-type cytochrome c oxidase subunit I [Candidatus Methanoperedens sp.]|nr:cbb3-type cytochrome c oxidase subunit I [Candidatus Methanoperedens sp.]
MEIPLKFAWASLIYLLIGSTMGAVMAINSLPLAPSHAHVLLIGWVSMMIFGVGYHLLPVFAGTDLYSLRLAEIHFWLQNTGLIGLAFTMPYRYAGESYRTGTIVFGLISLLAIYMFVYNVARSLIPQEKVEEISE